MVTCYNFIMQKDGNSVLFEEMFDYAGLLPPAALPMDEAVPEYLRHIAGEESWLVSKFVCPINWLGEFLSRLSSCEGRTSVPLSVLGTSVEGHRADTLAMERFLAEAGPDVSIDGYEVKLGKDAQANAGLKSLAKEDRWDIFIELPWTENLDADIELVASFETLGTKARLGGLEASAIPSCEQVARFIRGSADMEIPFKMTAGLHHPWRHFDAALGCNLHGFFNVAWASALAVLHDLPDAELVPILASGRPDDLSVSESGITAFGTTLSQDDLEESRNIGLATIGSCSISEPFSDLQKL